MFNSYTYNGIPYNSRKLDIVIKVVGSGAGSGFKKPHKKLRRIYFEIDVDGTKKFKIEKIINLIGTILKSISLERDLVGERLLKLISENALLGTNSHSYNYNFDVLGINQNRLNVNSKIEGTAFRPITVFENLSGTVRNNRLKDYFVVEGTKQIKIRESNRLMRGNKLFPSETRYVARGRKDITSILTVLDLLD